MYYTPLLQELKSNLDSLQFETESPQGTFMEFKSSTAAEIGEHETHGIYMTFEKHKAHQFTTNAPAFIPELVRYLKIILKKQGLYPKGFDIKMDTSYPDYNEIIVKAII